MLKKEDCFNSICTSIVDVRFKLFESAVKKAHQQYISFYTGEVKFEFISDMVDFNG